MIRQKLRHTLVSCIVPVLNGALFLRDAIDSILAQTHRPIEVIVVDDGSTDDTPAIVRSYGGDVRSLRQDNQGPAAARNAGLAIATGSLVAFLDADDLWHSEKLARQVARFAARDDLDVCFTEMTQCWVSGADLEAKREDGRVVLGSSYSFCTMLARRSLFDRIGGLDPNLRVGEDTDWMRRLSRHGAAVEVIPEALAVRRWHGENVSLRGPSLGRDEVLLRVARAVRERRGARELRAARR